MVGSPFRRDLCPRLALSRKENAQEQNRLKPLGLERTLWPTC